MKRFFVSALGATVTCLTLAAHADTAQVKSTTHWVIVDPGQPVALPSGAKGMATMRVHGTSIRSDGELTSQWCTGHQGVNAAGQEGGAGYCTIIADNGDILYVSFMTGGPDQKGTWAVMGGSGAYAGAKGGGTSTTISRRGDGMAWTTTSEGSITTQ